MGKLGDILVTAESHQHLNMVAEVEVPFPVSLLKLTVTGALGSYPQYSS
jgi:hypothetical protein